MSDKRELSEDQAREAFHALVREATDQIVATEEVLNDQRGATAIYDSTRDARFRSLPSFEGSARTVVTLPNFEERIGTDSAERVTLQIVYNYFDRATDLTFDSDLSTTVFDEFASELAKPHWTLVMLANLKQFESNDSFIDFGNGMTIRARNSDEIRDRLRWSDFQLDAFVEDWTGFGASDHVIWFEEELEKTPGTLVSSNTPMGSDALSRLLRALWLYREGDVNIGSVFLAEISSFSLRGRGVGRLIVPWSIPPDRSFGDATYSLDASEAPVVRSIYDRLTQFEADNSVPQNVRLAFGRFGTIYSRGLHQREERIVDSITALEALLGAKVETTFKLAFRVASILADNDDERAELLSKLKQFYGTRSRIVHGGSLRQRDQDLITNDASLRAIVRHVLVATLHLAVEHGKYLTEQFVNDLDEILVHSTNRDALRREMGLTT